MREGRESVVPVRKAMGRPRLVYRSTPVYSWVPESLFDRVAHEARSQGLTVSAYVRRVLVLSLLSSPKK